MQKEIEERSSNPFLVPSKKKSEMAEETIKTNQYMNSKAAKEIVNTYE